MTTASEIASRLSTVCERVAAAAKHAGRKPEEISLVGVAKRKSAELIAAAVRAGLRDVAWPFRAEAAGGVWWHARRLPRLGTKALPKP